MCHVSSVCVHSSNSIGSRNYAASSCKSVKYAKKNEQANKQINKSSLSQTSVSSSSSVEERPKTTCSADLPGPTKR